jgi:hypothetical protein
MTTSNLKVIALCEGTVFFKNPAQYHLSVTSFAFLWLINKGASH